MAILSYLLTRVDLLLYFTTCFVLFLYWINGSKKSSAKMPPGPKPLPLIGNFHLLDLKRPDKSLMELSEKYGEVFTVHFGFKKVVVLAGYKAVKDALVNQADDFADRPDVPLFKLISNGKGIAFSKGESWKTMRRFTLSTLRDFGMGKKTVEARIQDELIYLIEHFKSHNGKPFDTSIIMSSAICNVISSIIFGKRFEYDNAEFKKLLKTMADNDKLVGSPKVILYNYFPRIMSLLGVQKELAQAMDKQTEFILKRIKQKRQEFNVNDISGYIDAYLLKQEHDQVSARTETYYDDENLTMSASDLFSAGTETTSATLQWAILLMTKYPAIQKKVQEEIQAHIKQEQMPTADDRRKMPYTDAVIHEVQRFSNIIPMSLPHATAKDVHFRGYCIPKDTEVIPNLTSVLYDKTQWETPYEFNPNHFLDGSGKFEHKDAFMPFSAGRRICVGESLAKIELFLFFTGLLQTFTFHPPPGVSREDIDLSPMVGFLLVPQPYLLCAKLNS
ncbi:cytochrome P450 2K1-like [Hyperolius riggenbachi]|uniref:cytochrome P450 2K1-like n=1 Tax=Hyperolius riggenbachi TaxID=752182 RepID=UPI0035A2B080